MAKAQPNYFSPSGTADNIGKGSAPDPAKPKVQEQPNSPSPNTQTKKSTAPGHSNPKAGPQYI